MDGARVIGCCFSHTQLAFERYCCSHRTIGKSNTTYSLQQPAVLMYVWSLQHDLFRLPRLNLSALSYFQRCTIRPLDLEQKRSLLLNNRL